MYKVIITYELIFLAFWNILYLSNSDVENWFTEKFLTAIFVFFNGSRFNIGLYYLYKYKVIWACWGASKS